MPPRRTAKSISHHIDQLLRSCSTSPTHNMGLNYGLVTVFQAGEPGEVPALLLRSMDPWCFHRVPGTEGPKRHLHFLDSTHPLGFRRRYRFKLSARLAACWRYPTSPHARPMGLGHLPHPTEAYLAVCDFAAILSSTASAVFLQLTGRDSHPIIRRSGASGHLFPESVLCSHR